MSHRPDIVLLVLDTQRADRFSCYGYPAETTPHLDALAAEATLFSQAISTAQWTLPAHASMFTGLYPSQHTMTQLDSALPPALPTLAERLEQAGYRTAIFSNNPLIGAKNNGLQRGFQQISNYSSVGYGLWVSHLEDPTVETGSLGNYRQRMRRLLAQMLGYGEQAHRLTPIMGSLVDQIIRFRGGSKQQNAERSLSDAAELLLQRKGMAPEQPVFTFINLMGTHVPYTPAPWALEKFLGRQLGHTSAQHLLHHANNLGLDVNNWLQSQHFAAADQAVLNGVYDAEVATQDAQVGRFLQRLREGGVLEQTFLIVVADHGDHLGEKERVSHLFGAYRELVHVPLIIRDPRHDLPYGQTIDRFVSIRRLYHTILAAAGLTSPIEAELDLVYSLSESDDQPQEHNLAFVEAEAPAWVQRRMEQLRPGLLRRKGYDYAVKAVYHDDHKLIAKGSHLLELYAVRDDPAETQEIHATDTKETARLRSALQRFVQTSYPIVEPVSQVEEDPEILERLRDLGYVE